MIVTTDSGARYEFRPGQVRRLNPSHEKRGDGEWQNLRTMFPKMPALGHPMVLVMDSLAAFGQDDYGTPAELASDVTTRRTTPVRLIEASASTNPKEPE